MRYREYINQLTLKLSQWHQKHQDDDAFFYLVVVCIGVLSGICAAVLKGGVGFVMQLMFSALRINEGNWLFFLLPVVGIFVAMMFMHWVVRYPLDNATERITDDLSSGNGRLSPRIIWGSIIGCSITLGTGGSAGAESPIAYTGAAIGSNIGKAFRAPETVLVNLVGMGAAAGIAGIYMAPIGGVMFALEVLRMKQNLTTVLGLTFCSLTAALTSYILLGCHTDVSFVPEMRFDTHLIPYVLACGAVCGVYSLYYSKITQYCSRWFSGRKNVWVKATVGSLTMAGLLYLFPSLYGEGYDTIGRLMQGQAVTIIAYSPLYPLGEHFILLAILYGALLLVKPIATAATNESGGVGGKFTPTFFCGAALGFVFALVLNHYFGLKLPFALFAFFGMAAVMSGAVKAPLMAIFIAAEMTGLYGFILPLTLCAVSSFVTKYVLEMLISGPKSDNSLTASGNTEAS